MAGGIIAKLIAAGVAPELIEEVSDALADGRAAMRLLEQRRKADRERKVVSNPRIPRNSTEAEENAEFQENPLPNKSPPDPQKLTPPPLATRGRTTRAREDGTRLPDDWGPAKLSRDTISGQIIENRGQEWAKRTLESFKNHWRSARGPTARKLDWQATWANWVIEQDNRDGRRTNPLGRHQPSDGLSATRRAALRVFGAAAPGSQ